MPPSTNLHGPVERGRPGPDSPPPARETAPQARQPWLRRPQAGARFWLPLLLLLVAAVGLSVAARFNPYFPFDLRLERAVQSIRIPGFAGLMGFENTVGSPWPAVTLIAVIALVLFHLHDRRLSLLFVLDNAFRGAGSVIKWAVARPRPSATLVHVGSPASGASFPSGHVFSAVLLYGMVAVLVEALPLARWLRRGIQALCLLIIVLMGPARVYAGAHWPSDVVGGYLWGGALLLLACWIGVATRLLPWPLEPEPFEPLEPSVERIIGGGTPRD